MSPPAVEAASAPGPSMPDSPEGRSVGAGIHALEVAAVAATRAAALACQPWLGRGQPAEADAAATNAMRATLAGAPGTGTVVIGEGEKDDAPRAISCWGSAARPRAS